MKKIAIGLVIGALTVVGLVSLLVFSGLALFSHALNQTLRSGIDEELMNIAMQSRLVFEEKIKGRCAGLQMLASSMGAGNRDAVMGAIIKQNESLRQYRKLGAISVLGEHLYGDRIEHSYGDGGRCGRVSGCRWRRGGSRQWG